MTAVLAGCAHTQPTPTTVGAPGSTAELKKKLTECDGYLTARKLDEARRCAFAVEASGDYEMARRAAYTHVTALLYANDFTGSEAVFAKVMARDRRMGNAGNEAWVRNATTWLRWAQSDLDGALRENEAVRQIVEAAPLSDEDKRGILLHYWWDRAYLLLDVAATKPNDAAAAQAADEARRRYEALAQEPDENDGLAVLAAYFAVRRGDARAARAAALAVDPAQDGDIQDLYILWLAFDAAGDRAAADDILRRIDQGAEYPMKPLILRALASEKTQRP
jgi:hypothetical protein